MLSDTKIGIDCGKRSKPMRSSGAGGEALEFHHPDRLGTRLVTNNAANTSFEQSTLPFGTALPSESTGFSNQVFTSYDRSPIAGLDYAVNRTYSPGQGRFTQADPIGMRSAKIVNPQSLNLYAYVQNLPTDLVDPLGLCPPGEIPRTEITCVRVNGGEFECGATDICRSLNSRAGNSRGGGGIDADRRRGGGITDPGRKREPKPEKPLKTCNPGTIQIGIAGNGQLGPASAVGGLGIAIDLSGNVGFFTESGLGAGGGLFGIIGLQGTATTADSIYDLNGIFTNGSVGAGDEIAGSVHATFGRNRDGSPIVGGGGLAGGGGGAAASTAITYTTVTPLFNIFGSSVGENGCN